MPLHDTHILRYNTDNSQLTSYYWYRHYYKSEMYSIIIILCTLSIFCFHSIKLKYMIMHAEFCKRSENCIKFAWNNAIFVNNAYILLNKNNRFYIITCCRRFAKLSRERRLHAFSLAVDMHQNEVLRMIDLIDCCGLCGIAQRIRGMCLSTSCCISI